MDGGKSTVDGPRSTVDGRLESILRLSFDGSAIDDKLRVARTTVGGRLRTVDCRRTTVDLEWLLRLSFDGSATDDKLRVAHTTVDCGRSTVDFLENLRRFRNKKVTLNFMAFKFENLKVWQEALELTGLVHDVSLKFPVKELYVLTSQVKRAADSVALNIAEGSTGQSNLEFKKFLGYAIRSGIEIVACIYIARRRKIIADADFDLVYHYTDNLVKRIQALRNSIGRG